MLCNFNWCTMCLKLYDEDEGLKVNDVVEIIGVLSVDPSLAGHGTDEE